MRQTRYPNRGFQLKKQYSRLISKVEPNVVPTQRDSLGRPSNYGLSPLYLAFSHPSYYDGEFDAKEMEAYPGKHQ